MLKHMLYPTNFVYTLLCLDTNECNENNGGCEHICNNTAESFECLCIHGYVLGIDGKSCSGKYPMESRFSCDIITRNW